jgi:hypothetical protein
MYLAEFRETTGHNSVPVGLGSSSGATDVMFPITVPASGTITAGLTSFGKNWFSASSTQTLFIDSTAWGTASINVVIIYFIGA